MIKELQGIQLREYQSHAVNDILNNNKNSINISVGGGKTIIAMTLLKNKKGNHLIVAEPLLLKQWEHQLIVYFNEYTIINVNTDILSTGNNVHVINHKKESNKCIFLCTYSCLRTKHFYKVNSIFSGANVIIDESSIIASLKNKTRKVIEPLIEKSNSYFTLNGTVFSEGYGKACNEMSLHDKNFLAIGRSLKENNDKATKELFHKSVADVAHVNDLTKHKNNGKDFSYNTIEHKLIASDKLEAFIDEAYTSIASESYLGIVSDSYRRSFGIIRKSYNKENYDYNTYITPKNTAVIPKIQKCIEIIRECKNIIVWANHEPIGNIVVNKIRQAGIMCGTINGKVSKKERIRTIEAFKYGKINVIVANQKVLGKGIDFTDCSNMIFLDVAFSRDLYEQSVGRCNRLTSKEKLNVHHVFYDGQLEHDVFKKIKKKEKTSSKIIASVVLEHKKNIIKELI